MSRKKDLPKRDGAGLKKTRLDEILSIIKDGGDSLKEENLLAIIETRLRLTKARATEYLTSLKLAFLLDQDEKGSWRVRE